MYIHAKPVAGSVHVKRCIFALLDHIVYKTVFIGVQNAQRQQTLAQNANAGIVWIAKEVARFRCTHCSLLCLQNTFVDVPLRAREAAIGGKGPRDVAGIAMKLTACIDQHQVARQDRCFVSPVVKNTGIGSRCNDGCVGRVLRAVTSKFMQQLSFEMVLLEFCAISQSLGTKSHRFDMCSGRDLASPFHDVYFMRIFY